jgi:hypothetical protein
VDVAVGEWLQRSPIRDLLLSAPQDEVKVFLLQALLPIPWHLPGGKGLYRKEPRATFPSFTSNNMVVAVATTTTVTSFDSFVSGGQLFVNGSVHEGVEN